MKDLDGDGTPEIVFGTGGAGGTLAYAKPDPADPTRPWIVHAISQPGVAYRRAEGASGAEMVVYDVNGDGLNDVVTGLNAHGWRLAWFEQRRGTDGTISFERHMIIDDYSTENAGGVAISRCTPRRPRMSMATGFPTSSPGNAIPQPIGCGFPIHRDRSEQGRPR